MITLLVCVCEHTLGLCLAVVDHHYTCFAWATIALADHQICCFDVELLLSELYFLISCLTTHQADLSLIFRNAKEFNMPGSQIYNTADDLLKRIPDAVVDMASEYGQIRRRAE